MRNEILTNKVSDSASDGIWTNNFEGTPYLLGFLGNSTEHSNEGFPLMVHPSMEGLSAGLPGRQTQNTGEEEKEEFEQLELFFDLPPPDIVKASSPFSSSFL
jgi:hypothetical protein